MKIQTSHFPNFAHFSEMPTISLSTSDNWDRHLLVTLLSLFCRPSQLATLKCLLNMYTCLPFFQNFSTLHGHFPPCTFTKFIPILHLYSFIKHPFTPCRFITTYLKNMIVLIFFSLWFFSALLEQVTKWVRTIMKYIFCCSKYVYVNNAPQNVGKIQGGKYKN